MSLFTQSWYKVRSVLGSESVLACLSPLFLVCDRYEEPKSLSPSMFFQFILPQRPTKLAVEYKTRLFSLCDMSIHMYIIICVTQIMVYTYILLGTLNFVTLYSANKLVNADDTWSSSISTDGGFPFGTGTIYSVYVRKRLHVCMACSECVVNNYGILIIFTHLLMLRRIILILLTIIMPCNDGIPPTCKVRNPLTMNYSLSVHLYSC